MFETGVDAMIHMQKAVRCKYMREGEYYGSIHSFPHPLVTSFPSPHLTFLRSQQCPHRTVLLPRLR